MGNTQTSETPQVVTKPKVEAEKVDNFGSYNDPENPRPGYYLLKTKKQVFYRGKLMPKVDFETFKKLGQGLAEDKNNKYLKGVIVKGK